MEIADWRAQIDDLDEQIVRLLNQRAAAAVEIGRIKQRTASAIYEPTREQAVFAHVAEINPGPLTAAQLQDIDYRVMDVMRSLQRVEPATLTESRSGEPQTAVVGEQRPR